MKTLYKISLYTLIISSILLFLLGFLIIWLEEPMFLLKLLFTDVLIFFASFTLVYFLLDYDV